MPRQKLNDLAKFQCWLTESYQLTNGGASVYASKVRKVLKNVDEVSANNLQSFIEKPENLSSRDLFLTSWKRFVEFLSETQNVTIPPMKRPKKTNLRRIFIAPAILEMAHFLKHRINLPYNKILSFKWQDLRSSRGLYWDIVDPHEHSTIYRIPAHLCQELCFHCFGDDPIVGNRPIFPMFPGSKESLNRNNLSTHLRHHIPQYECRSIELSTRKPVETLEVDIPMIESNSDIEERLKDYSMFNPDDI